MKFLGIHFIIYSLPCAASFTANEIEAGVEIFKKLEVRHCVFVIPSQSILLNHKEIYNYNLFISQIPTNHLKNSFNKAKWFHLKTGFMMKDDGINVLRDLFVNNPLKVSKFTWMVFTNKNISGSLNVPYNCEFLIVQSGVGNDLLISEIYYVKNTGPFDVNFGVWSSATGLVVNTEIYNQRRNMKGATLIRSDRDNVGYCNRWEPETKNREIWLDFSFMLNFSLIPVNDMLKNESTDPMSPDGSSCLVAHHALNQHPDNIVNPTCTTYAFFTIKYESDLGQGLKSYLKPFNDDLWYSTFAFLIVSTALLTFIVYCKKGRFWLHIFTPLYSLCYQGDDADIKSFANLSIWLAYLMPVIAATVIVPAYSAAILSKLMVQTPKVPFTDFEGSAKDGTFKLMALNNTFLLDVFAKHKDPLLNRLYLEHFIDKNDYPNTFEEVGALLCSDKKIALVTLALDESKLNLKCKLYKINHRLMRGQTGFRMKNGSPLTQVFQQEMIKFYSSGVIKRKNLTKAIEWKVNNDDDLEPITILQVLTALGLLPLGIFLGLVVLTMELIANNRKNKAKSNNS